MFGNLIPWKKQQNEDLSIRENDPLVRFRQEFDQLWERFWNESFGSPPGPGPASRQLGPRVKFDDNEKEYVLHAELPGFDPKDFEVTVSGNVLTLRAEQKEEKQDGNGHYRHYGSFSESFTLPHGVLADQIDAHYHSGVLELHLPKSDECRTKRIEVKSV